MLAKLKEQLAEQKNIITLAKQEMKEAQEMEETQAFAEAGKDVENIEFVNAKSSRSEEAEDPKERAESPKSDKIPAKNEDGDQEKALEALKEKNSSAFTTEG